MYNESVQLRSEVAFNDISNNGSLGLFMISIILMTLSVLIATPNTAFAADYAINCDGSAGAPTAVTESSYTSSDNVTFRDAGGDGYCALDEPLTALSVTLETGVVLTHTSQDTDGVTITAGNMDIRSGATISVEKRGCAGGSSQANGTGPDINDSDADLNTLECVAGQSGYGDGSYDSGAGGSHGGVGGRAADSFTGTPYDSATTPVNLGSGGGGANAVNGGSGGGLVKLTVAGNLTINGDIDADGGAGQAGTAGGEGSGGGGGGGSVYIIADTITGSASITASGGTGAARVGVDGGGGGGGRIVIYYDTNNAFTLANVTASKGVAGGTDTNAADGAPGSTFLLDRETDDGAGTLTITSGLDFTSSGDYARDNIVISTNASLTCPSAITTLTISATNDITDNGARWTCSSAITTLNLSAVDTLTTANINWVLSGVSALNLSAATWTSSGTNVMTLATAGTLVDWNVTNALTLNNLTYTGSAPGTTSATGGVITMNNAIDVALVNTDISSSVSWTGLASLGVDATSSIVANGLGCAGGASQGNGYGPNSDTGVCAISTTGYGYGNYDSGSGAGHGGAGGFGEYQASAGTTYGSNTAPILFGSGGGGKNGVIGIAGGGIVRLDVTGTTTIAGAISANGSNASSPSGAGSGGSVYMTTGTLAGDGTVKAVGGNGATVGGVDSGGGGGGRVAIKYATNSSTFLASMTASNSATGGTKGGAAAGDGSDGTLSTTQYSVPSALTITAPTEAATSQSRAITTTTSAYSSDGASHTTTSWQISDNNTFSDSDCSDTNIVFCNMTSSNLESVAVNSSNGTFQNALNGLTQLAPNTQYYVRARHTNAVGSSSWSTAVSFTTTANVAPTTPTNSAPANSATDVSKNPTLSSSAYSNSDSDAHKYSDWSLFESDACAGTADWTKTGDQTNLTSIVVNTTNGTFADALDGRTTLKAHTTYSFRVRYTDLYDGTSSNSACTLFTTTNTAPAYSSIPTQSLTEDINATGAFDLDTYFSDVDFNDNDDYACTVTNELSAALGTMTLNGDRTVDFTLVANANGTDTIQFSCEDGGGLTTASNSITVNVAAVNDTPTANAGTDQTVTEDDTVTLNATNSADIDTGDTLTYAWSETTDSGDACNISAFTGATPTVTLSNKDTSYSCIYSLTVNDGTINSAADTVTINVTADNDAPTIASTASTSVELDEDDTLVIPITASDDDTSILTLTASETTNTLTTTDLFTDNGDNTGTFQWATDYEDAGDYTLEFTATDGTTTDTLTIAVTVNDVVTNTDPTFTGSLPNITFLADQTTRNLFDLDDFFSDTDTDDILTYTVTGNEEITVRIKDNGNVQFTATNFTGTEAILFTATDLAGATVNSNPIVVTVQKAVLKNVSYISGSHSGTGIITVYNKANKVVAQWRAFRIGGAIPRIATINGTPYVFVIKYGTGTTIHIYTLSGEHVVTQALSPKLHWKRMATGDLNTDTENEEIVVATKRGRTAYFKLYQFNPTKKRLSIVAKTKYTGVGKQFNIKVEDNTVRLYNKAGKLKYVWWPFGS